MKLLLLLAFVGLAASASLRSRDFKANTPRELQYQYDAQIATGIEEVSSDFSTLRMRFRVIMRTDGSVDADTGAERWSLVFRSVNMRQRNNATDQLPKTLLPMEQFRNIEQPDLWLQMERTLKKPFAVLIRPKELSIAKVLFSEEDPFWSVNIKKGFLSLLQVNFIPKDTSSSSMEKGQWTKETEETTVAATCKTFYSANKIEFHESDSQVFRVDKAIDFNKCLNPIDGTWSTPGVWNGLRHVRMLPGDQQKNLVDVNNMAQYLVDMGSDRRTPTIRKASAKTVHIMSPYSDSTHGSEKIFSVQQLRLLTNFTTEEATIDISGLTEQPEGIRLTYPEETKNIDREALKNKVVELFGSLFDSSEVDAKIYESILRILRFHLTKEEDLRVIAQELSSRFSDKHLKAFILDFCPQIGSHGAVKFLMQVVKMLAKINSPQDFVNRANLNIYHISVIFTKLSMMEKVQLKMLQTVFEVVKDEAFQSKLMNADLMPIFSTAWLSTGAMVNVYYGKQGGVEPYMHPIKDSSAELRRKYSYAPWEVRQSHAVDSEEFRREFVRIVREWLQKSDMGRNLALKVTKNCGLFELYDQLAPMLRKRDTTKVTERVQAIYATQNMLLRNTLVRVTAEDPRSVSQEEKYIRDNSQYRRHFERISSQIQADLITCFRNVREDPEVRIACYRVLMQCPNIKQTVLNMLIQSILTEPTQQVYSYCVRHMDQIAQNPLPRYNRVSQTVRSALSMLKRREPFDLVYSRVFHGQLWDELHKMGLTIETDMIVSDKSFTPRWTHIRVEHQGMGMNMPLLEIGLRTQGLQGLLEKLVGPRGLIYKVGGAMNLLRSRRSADASVDSEELLQILPRFLEELPNMDLTVAVMGYDVVYVKNTRRMADSMEKLNKKALLKSLTSFGKFMQPFDGLFTISSNFEMPTPAGTVLDFNCLMTLDFAPRIVPTVAKNNEGKAELAIRAFLPINIHGFKRIGSNMHVLNHYHQWMTTLKVNRQVFYDLSLKVDTTNSKHIVVYHKLGAPSSKAPIVEFENTAFTTICESHFTSGRVSFRILKQVIKHRKVAEQREVDYTPVFSNILAPFGYKVQVQGKYYSTRHLYQAPCSLLMGPSEYTIFLVPTLEDMSERSTIISSKLEIIYPMEESKVVPEIKLQINNVRASADESSETIRQKLVFATFTPREMSAKRISFDCNLRWFLNLPSSYRTSGYQMKMRGEIEMPEDLKMKPRSIPLQPEEWFVNRQLRMTINVRDNEMEVATIQLTKSTNKELKKLLVGSDLTEKDMKKMYPRLVACLNESRKSIKEEPLTANPLYTPSCIRQFKKFNKLSQTKIEIFKRASWFMSQKNSPMFDQMIQTIDYYLKPYLALSEVPRMTENKITIVSRPSPVDMRVQHLNVTTPTRKNIWRSIQLPSVPFFWAGVDPLSTAAADYVKGGASKCSLFHSHIRTFDNVIYSIPKSLFRNIADNQCPILLAKDCSPRNEFQVLTHIKDGKKHVTVHLNTESKPFIIDVSKPINSEQIKSIVKVNGAELEHSTEPKEETEIMRRQITTEKGPVTIVISKYHYADTVMYKIESIEHGVRILIGGPKLRTVEIRVSPFYHNKVCGLCGDYNSEKFREFKAPNYHQVMSTPKKMVKQYVLPISESCKMGQESQTEFDSENSLYLPNKIWYKSFDMPSRRPSCQIIDNRRVKTFKHAELKMVSPALQQIIRETDCAVKLAVAKIGEHRVRIFLMPSQSKVLIQVGSFKQYLSTASPAVNELSRDYVPSGLTADVKADSELAKFVLSKGENRVTVKVTSDKRVIIKASEISESEDAICELSHQSQIVSSEDSQVFGILKKFTNAEESITCRDQLKKKINQCQVSGNKVAPFYRSRDYSRWQVRFLNNDLKNRLAQNNAPIVLSVDQIGDDVSTAHSVHLVHSQEADRLVRHVLLKRNRQTLVKVSVPESGAARVTYQKDSSERTVVPSGSSQTIDIDGDFALTVSGERVQVVHKKNLYELDVQLSNDEPKISIVRPYAHSAYTTTGLCQVNRLPEVRHYRSNPQAVLRAVLESSLSALDSSAPILSEEEVGKINRQISDFSDYYMLA